MSSLNQGSSAQASSQHNQIFDTAVIITTPEDPVSRIFEYQFNRNGLLYFPSTYVSTYQQEEVLQHHQLFQKVNKSLGSVIPMVVRTNNGDHAVNLSTSDYLISRASIRMSDGEVTNEDIYENVDIAIRNALSDADGNPNTLLKICIRHPRIRRGPVYIDNVTLRSLKRKEIYDKINRIRAENPLFKIDRDLQIEVDVNYKSHKKHVIGTASVAKAIMIWTSYGWDSAEQFEKLFNEENVQESKARWLCNHYMKSRPESPLAFIETFARLAKTKIVVVSKNETRVFNENQKSTFRLLEKDGSYDAILPTDI